MRAHFVTILLCFLGVAWSACKTTSNTLSAQGFADLCRGYDSGIEEHGLVVARSAEEWKELWAKHTSRVVAKPDMPSVDWDRDMVIGVMLGERSTAGFAVIVDRVSEDDERWIVDAHESRPAADAFVPQVITHPYHFVVVKRSSATPELRMR